MSVPIAGAGLFRVRSAHLATGETTTACCTIQLAKWCAIDRLIAVSILHSLSRFGTLRPSDANQILSGPGLWHSMVSFGERWQKIELLYIEPGAVPPGKWLQLPGR